MTSSGQVHAPQLRPSNHACRKAKIRTNRPNRHFWPGPPPHAPHAPREIMNGWHSAPKGQRQTSALSTLRFGVRLQFVSEVGVIGLFQDITQLSTPLPRNASCSPRVSFRTPAQVPVGEGRVRGVRKNAWASRREAVTNGGEHESPSPRPSPAGQRRSFVVIDDCSTRTVRGRGGKRERDRPGVPPI